MTDWLGWVSDAVAEGPVALVSVLASEGSAPRGAGTRMVVAGGRLYGTIGGGQLEYQALEQARAILGHAPGSWRVQDYPLGPLLAQCCGGRVRLLVEQLDPTALDWLGEAAEGRVLVSSFTPTQIERRIADDAMPVALSARGARPVAGASYAERLGRYRRPLYLFGAGHVGQAVARHAAPLPFRLAWFDTRAAQAAIEGVTLAPEDSIEQCVAEAPEDAAIVILTHDHALDYRLARAALDRPAAFVGLIGSATKRARFEGRLAREGVVTGRLTCPIGVAGVEGKEPDVIAIATLAQLLQLGAPA